LHYSPVWMEGFEPTSLPDPNGAFYQAELHPGDPTRGIYYDVSIH
jgi:hypothetical protein